MDLKVLSLELLRKLGVETGQSVLDFGCGSGTYAIPAVEIVGQKGRVYALDKDHNALDELMENAQRTGLQNVERMDCSGDVEIGLSDESIDVVLLFDVFHSYYFPESRQRGKLLGEIHRILNPNGVLLVYPKHMETEAKREIEDNNFCLQREYAGRIIHDQKELVEGYVLIFGKKPNDNR